MQVERLAGIYARISEDDAGDAAGVERQVSDCRALAARLGVSVYRTYIDNDISAYKKVERPEYDALTADIEAGLVKVVLALHPDRLYRRNRDLEPLIDLCEKFDVEIHTVHAGELDLSTASGRMIARMLGAAATHEVERGIERMRAAKRQAALNGEFLGGVRRFGWDDDFLTLHPDEAEAIRIATKEVTARTKSLQRIANEWREAGLKTSKGGEFKKGVQVRKILERWANAGIVMHNGERLGQAQWEPIITESELLGVRAVLKENSDRQPGKTSFWVKRHLGAGLYICGKCGSTVKTGYRRADKAGQTSIRVYVCPTSHLSRAADYIDEFVAEMMIQRLEHGGIPERSTDAGEDLNALLTEREGVKTRMRELAAMFTDGVIEGDQLKTGTARLKSKLTDLDTRIADARHNDLFGEEMLSADEIRESWPGLEIGTQTAIVDALATITLLPMRSPRFKPESVLIEWK
ncbi:recombinase family protein [Nocardia transvalensis]|uniref:recombinase family protein n=1 Tax=Nocardia transvalensis TaxID=37333 RepID=UPI00189607FB|nr:recombinase family protein [Nocardia transvalensis]MBF6333464.1 recombinase family protein [Nocardia transvalensis]